MTALNALIATITADIATTRQKLTKNATELQRVETVGEQARKVCRDAAELRQKRTDILSRLIMSGSSKLTSRELEAADAAIEAFRPEEQRAEDLLKAQGNVLESLQQEAAELARLLAEQTRGVLLKQQEAGAIEIETEALPAVLAAAEALRVAYARLAGLRSAHGINAKLIHERCGGQAPYSAYSLHSYNVEIQCFGVALPAPHQGGTDGATVCRTACADALRRWGSIGEEVPTGHEARAWPPLR